MNIKSLALATVFSAIALPNLAFAYDPDNSADVFSRPRPEFDARGVRLGSFVLFPTLNAGLAYQDNVLNVPESVPATEDFAATLNPTLKLNSDWSRHALNFRAESISYFFQDLSDEDRTDWSVGADGRIDIGNGINVAANVGYEGLTEPRSTDTAVTPFYDQTEYSVLSAGGSINYTGPRLRASLGVDYADVDFDDISAVATVASGPLGDAVYCSAAAIGFTSICNNDDRDHTVFGVTGKLGVAISPSHALFVRGRYNEIDFDTLSDGPGAYNKDSDGWSAEGGIDFELSRMLVGEAYIGYYSQDYVDPRYATTDGISFGSNLKWFASMLTTVSLDVKRAIRESNFAQGPALTAERASGVIADSYGVRLDHELMRNVVLFGKVAYAEDAYQFDTVLPALFQAREDQSFSAGLGAVFLVNNNLHLTASYDFIDRDSNLAAFNYSNNVFQLTLTGKM